MTASSPDPERLPVVIASGQAVEREELVTATDLMERASEAAFADAPGMRGSVERVSVVNILSRSSSAPATELAQRLGVAGAVCEVSTVGGNTPQWLVSRAAEDIARGNLSATLIAGAEAIRSSRARRAQGAAPDHPSSPAPELPADRVIGDDWPAVGPAESAIGLMAPVQIYPLFESVLAARAGRDAAAQRCVIGTLFAPFTEVAAGNPYAWFRQVRTAEAIATPTPDNRIVAEPYTKRMTAFLGSDQGAALIVCSFAAAVRAGVGDRAVFIWAGAEATDVRFPAARPDPGRSPAIAAAGSALFDAVSRAAGGGTAVGIDDIEVLDIYSCFPSAVELAIDALGIAPDDRRRLTSTGGLPYFGGPGNNYTTHGIAAVTDILRQGRGAPDDAPAKFGMATGLGWFVTKHALGVYGSAPPPSGYQHGDTTTAQARIDASAVETALEVDTPTLARVVAATVLRDNEGVATSAPLVVRLPDGRHMALNQADDEVLGAMGRLDVPGLVGTTVVVERDAPRYRLATD
ncbi:MAG: acetyl-CoA acetyltransferase [Acidimicrobiales bacterium]